MFQKARALQGNLGLICGVWAPSAPGLDEFEGREVPEHPRDVGLDERPSFSRVFQLIGGHVCQQLIVNHNRIKTHALSLEDGAWYF